MEKWCPIPLWEEKDLIGTGGVKDAFRNDGYLVIIAF